MAKIEPESSKIDGNLEASTDTTNCKVVDADAQKNLLDADLILGSPAESSEAAAGSLDNNPEDNLGKKKKRKRRRFGKKVKSEDQLQTMEQSDINMEPTESITEVNVNGKKRGGIDEVNIPLKFSKDEEVEISARTESSVVGVMHQEAECLSKNVEQNLGITSIPLVARKLIVLDVNGLLANIVMPAPKDYRCDAHILGRAIFKRPFCDDFLKFCFQNFDVGVWSSRSKRIIDRVVDYLLGDQKDKLLFCWDMSHSTETGFNTLENIYKPLVFKELRKIWKNDDTSLCWKSGDYSESNTLLLDDSPYKALLNPLHTAIFPNSYHYKDTNDNSLGPGGDLRVYLEGLLSSENVQNYVEQHPFGQNAINETNSSWDFYSGVLKSASGQLQDDTPNSLPTLS